MFMVGIFMVSTLALMTPWLQVLSHYPVETAGLIMAPRGFGSLVTTMLSGQLASRVDPRVLVGFGLVLLTYTYWVMTHWTPDVAEREIIVTVIIQGAAMGFLWDSDPVAGVRYAGTVDANRGRRAVQSAAKPGFRNWSSQSQSRCSRGTPR